MTNFFRRNTGGRCHNAASTHVASSVCAAYAAPVTISEPSQGGLHQTPLPRLVARPVARNGLLQPWWRCLYSCGRRRCVNVIDVPAGGRNVGEVLGYVGEIDVASRLSLQASLSMKSSPGIL